MLTLKGPAALTPARLARRLERLRRDNPGVSAVSARFVHFVDLAAPLDAAAMQILDRLLQYGPRLELNEVSGRELLVVPRLGTISPWSSKASDIAHNCGL
jgi:phosphoribosylformylglycinamidine synthase